MIDLGGEVDFAASDVEDLAERVVARAEAGLPIDASAPAEQSIPVRRVGVRPDRARMQEVLGAAAVR